MLDFQQTRHKTEQYWMHSRLRKDLNKCSARFRQTHAQDTDDRMSHKKQVDILAGKVDMEVQKASSCLRRCSSQPCTISQNQSKSCSVQTTQGHCQDQNASLVEHNQDPATCTTHGLNQTASCTISQPNQSPA